GPAAAVPPVAARPDPADLAINRWLRRSLRDRTLSRVACSTLASPRRALGPGARLLVSVQQRGGGVLEDAGDVGEEAGALLAVDVPVVEAQRERRHLANNHFVIHHPRLLPDRAEGEDRGFTRVDDRGPAVDAEDTDVGDRERAAGHLRRLRLAR